MLGWEGGEEKVVERWDEERRFGEWSAVSRRSHPSGGRCDGLARASQCAPASALEPPGASRGGGRPTARCDGQIARRRGLSDPGGGFSGIGAELHKHSYACTELAKSSQTGSSSASIPA